MKHLVLFDIDGTLLRCGRQVGSIFVQALEDVYGGWERPEGYSFAGKTDPMIVVEMTRGVGLGEDDVRRRLPEMRATYLRRLEEGLRREGMVLLPGVVHLLERLSARDDVAVGLLTGNWQGGADVKLSRFDLGRFFGFGAFGGDAADRRGLVPVALDRAEAHTGRRFAPEETWIIGDTPLDVDCARAAGAVSMAVATGFVDAEDLRRSGADWVFDDLEHASREIDLFAP
ncbi:MAG: HAD hydrolase-like protein [Acidobacteriota bacterium]